MSHEVRSGVGAFGEFPIGLIPLVGLPEVVQGDDLGRLIVERAAAGGTPITSGGLVVVAQKVVSKAEGAVVRVSDQVPTGEALELAERVSVVAQKERKPYAPRITIAMKDGTHYQGEYTGDELKWGLATEIRRIREVFPNLPVPASQELAVARFSGGTLSLT